MYYHIYYSRLWIGILLRSKKSGRCLKCSVPLSFGESHEEFGIVRQGQFGSRMLCTTLYGSYVLFLLHSYSHRIKFEHYMQCTVHFRLIEAMQVIVLGKNSLRMLILWWWRSRLYLPVVRFPAISQMFLIVKNREIPSDGAMECHSHSHSRCWLFPNCISSYPMKGRSRSTC
jgi:hypothetical protein